MARGYSFRGISPRHGLGASIAIFQTASFYGDLTPVPFTVTSPADIFVSGGGNTLAGAIGGSPPPGTRFLITDSLNYSPITIQNATNITIEADIGQTPTITANSGDLNNCVRIGAVQNNGVALKKLTFVGNGNAPGFNPGNQSRQGLVAVNNTTIPQQRIIIEDCTFTEPMATVNSGAPGLQLVGTGGLTHQDVWVHRCTFKNNAASLPAATPSGWGACTVAGYTNVYIQNCLIVRQNSVVSRGVSPMKGVVVRSNNAIIEHVLCDDLGTGGTNAGFYQPVAAGFGSLAGSATFNNCVAYNMKLAFLEELAGSTYTANNCVSYVDIPGIIATTFSRNPSGTYTLLNSVGQAPGDGFAFFPGAPYTENHNDIFNFGTVGIVLDPTDQQIDPVLSNPSRRIYVATAPTLQNGASDGGLVGVRYMGSIFPNTEIIFWVNTPQGT